ncbi:MAG: terminase [Eubacterium sp. 45_250]|nr:MAG: terminase [Eubacterium sp. 45_250]
MTTVRLSEVIAPSFYDLHKDIKQDKHTHYWLKGGRGSTKSSFVSEELITGIMRNSEANAVVIRKVGLYLKDSVYEQLLWAISKLGVERYWQEKLSPLELVYVPTGQRIIFRGADKPKKLKSTKVRSGYIRYAWYEETDEFNGIEEIRTINQSLLRGGETFTVFYTFNPPKSQRNWINSEVLVPRSDKIVHHSDYRSVPAEWLGEQFLIEAKHLEQTKPEQYRHEYLGEVTGTGAEVFTNITIRPITDEEIKSFDHIKRGIDWGYGADPFVYITAHFDSKRNRLFIFYEFFRCAAKYDVIANAIRKENTQNGTIIAESAEPRSNDELRDRGFRIRTAVKGPGSVEHGITWLQNLEEIVIDGTRCPNAAREFNEYELDRDSRGELKADFPDKNNHTIDAIRYALEDYIGRKIVKSTLSKRKLGIY